MLIHSGGSHFRHKKVHRPHGQEGGGESKKIGKVDYFKVFFRKKVGYPPPRNLLGNFKEFNHFVNRPKLTLQTKKIGRLCDKCFHPEKREEEHEVHHFAHEHIDERIRYSHDRMDDLRAEIQAKLKKLAIHKLRRHARGDLVELLVHTHWIAIQQFIKLYLAAELNLADQLIHDGMLMTHLSPLELIKKIVNELLPPPQ